MRVVNAHGCRHDAAFEIAVLLHRWPGGPSGPALNVDGTLLTGVGCIRLHLLDHLKSLRVKYGEPREHLATEADDVEDARIERLLRQAFDTARHTNDPP
jgi:hypothetical protein